MAFLDETGLAYFWGKVKAKITASKTETINAVYPIGSIYMSVNSTSPASLFGGTWEQIKDRFLLAAGSSYSAGSTGGEATHTLTTTEMPAHHHDEDEWLVHSYNRYTGQGVRTTSITNEYNVFGTIHSGKTAENQSCTSTTGGGAEHNNMPPYVAVYMWKRMA